MRIAEILTAPRSPWQNAFAERVIGTIRCELLDHVIVLNEQHLRRRLRSYLRYYHGSRTHLALDKDAPEPRDVEPPEYGRVIGPAPSRRTTSPLRPPRSVIAVAAQRGARPGAGPVSAKQNGHLRSSVPRRRNAKLQGDGRDWVFPAVPLHG